MADKCGDEGCLVDRLEAQFEKGIAALQRNQTENMNLIRETIEAQLVMVSESVREIKSDNTHSHDEMFTRLRKIELQGTAFITDSQVRLLLRDAFEANEEVRAVARWRSSCRKWQIGVAIGRRS